MLQERAARQLQDQQNPPSPGQPSAQDIHRRSKIAAVEAITGRPLIVYASACTQPKPIPGQLLMIDAGDKIGFETATEIVDGSDLDVLIHSPGGYAEAAESLVQQLRAKYTHIRFIVPSFAKSAATMFVMSGNEILMDRDAELGPIDPQMRTQNGTSPAVAILELFNKAQSELSQDPTKLASWMPILSQLGPSLLVDCVHAIELSRTLVENWTRDYMFAGDADSAAKATRIAEFLSDHAKFKSHGRAVKIPDLLPLGVRITDIRTSPALHAAIMELYCCLDIFLGNSPAYKIYENSRGGAMIRQQSLVQVPVPVPAPMPRPPQNVPAPPQRNP